MKPNENDLEAVCRLADALCGIQWDASKDYLVESRLKRLLILFGFQDYEQLAKQARNEPQIRTAFINAITTRETLFFRDESSFLALKRKVLPEIIDRKSGAACARRLRVWSAACSSGQEPYSLAITLLRSIPDIHTWDVQILATDISDEAIAQASRGTYSAFEIGRGLDPSVRDRYFVRRDGDWTVRDEVRSLVTFEQRNLLESFSRLEPFDVIFCRNVAIYFDLPIKRDLFERLAGVLTRDGALFVGTSEFLDGFGPRWIPHHHGRTVFYRPNLGSRLDADSAIARCTGFAGNNADARTIC